MVAEREYPVDLETAGTGMGYVGDIGSRRERARNLLLDRGLIAPDVGPEAGDIDRRPIAPELALEADFVIVDFLGADGRAGADRDVGEIEPARFVAARIAGIEQDVGRNLVG
jgi:hypothetical protein